MPSTPFTLRYDQKEGLDDERVLQWVREHARTPDILAVFELAKQTKKPHFHILFWYDKTESTLGQHFRPAFPELSGKKKEWCIKAVTDLYGAEKYHCKGAGVIHQPDVRLQTGKYTIERVIELHADWFAFGGPRDEQPEYTGNPSEDIRAYGQAVITHRIEKIVKPKKNFFNDVIEHLRKTYPDRVWNIRDTPLMLDAVLKLHGRLFRPYGPTQLENEMNVIMNILVPESHYADMYEQLKARRNIPHL